MVCLLAASWVQLSVSAVNGWPRDADLKSLDYTVVGAFLKIFKTKSKEIASCCMEMFNCSLPSVSVNNRKCKFLQKFSAFDIICRHCVDCAK